MLFSSEWPVDADGLAEWLYLAAAQRGDADPVATRAFAEGVWHMANGEFAQTPSLEEMNNAIIKWTRELGQPLWAESLARVTLKAPADGWPHHLLAAHELGICEIDGRESPQQMIGGWVPYQVGDRFDEFEWLAALGEANHRFCRFAVVSNQQFMQDHPSIATACQRLQQALDETNLALIVNLNWPAASDADGPSLFPTELPNEAKTDSADAIEVARADRWRPADLNRLTWRWHVRGADLRGQGNFNTQRACECAVLGGCWQFALTRSRHRAAGSIELLDDNGPVMQSVTVNLHRLLRQEYESINSAEDALGRIASLARIVLEIGHVRRRMIFQSHPGAKHTHKAELLVRIRTGGTSNQPFQQQAWDQFREAFTHDPHLQIKMIPVVDEWPLMDFINSAEKVAETITGNSRSKRLRVRVDPAHCLSAKRLNHLLENLCKSRATWDLIVESGVPEPKSDSQLIVT